MSDPFGLRSLDLETLRRRDGAKWHAHPADYAAWVADMDFPVAPAITEALRTVIDRNELGYPNWGGPYAPSPAARLFPERMSDRFGWDCEPDRVRDLVDVLQGVRATVLHCSQPGDGVVLHLPAYHPFLATIDDMDRRLVPVHFDPDDRAFDYDRLDAELDASGARVWILCHPHNPLGHVFARAELETIAELADRHDLVVVSDEIHADLVMPGASADRPPATTSSRGNQRTEQERSDLSADSPGNVHVPFEALGPEVSARTVTVTSSSKAFNLAGLRWAVMHAGHRPLHDSLAALPGHYLGAPNVLAVTATVAAWKAGAAWLDAVIDVLDENRHALVDLLDAYLPGTRYAPPAATYLAWVDCRALGFGDDPAATFRRRGVELSPGPQFGPPGAGHVRINLATSPAILAETVRAMAG